jgi:hypothetical protein
MIQRYQASQALETAVLSERLRQARYSFNMALFSATACGLAGVVGIVMTLTGKLPEGAYITTGSMPAIAACLQCAKDANDRLDHLLEEISKND